MLFKDFKTPFIYVFDSGVGGISVLRELVRRMPGEDFLYFGDSKNAPYGTKETEEVRRLTTEHVERALDAGAKAVCIACNTATSAAVRYLREKHPDVPLVGIEPAVKPAALGHPGGRVLAMATPITIREEKFQKLISRFRDSAEIIPMACPGLMEFVEEGRVNEDDIIMFLRQLLRNYADGVVDAAVLGCTHYPFVRPQIQKVLGQEVEIYDGAYGTAKELKRRLDKAGLSIENEASNGRVVIETSLDGEAAEQKREQCYRMLKI